MLTWWWIDLDHDGDICLHLLTPAVTGWLTPRSVEASKPMNCVQEGVAKESAQKDVKPDVLNVKVVN